jgi:hypothetical protein
MSDLELLADTMEEWSSTSGDHHMLAAAAIRQLIKLQASLQHSESTPVAWHISKDPDGDQSSHVTADGEFASSYAQMGWKVSPLYTTPQPVVDVNQQLVDALRVCEECLMFIHGGEPLRTDVPLKLAREALLSAGKGGEL